VGDLTLSQYQSAVIRTCGNVESTHPVISAGDHTRAINAAVNELIRMFPDKFPEHHNRSWTLGPTVVGTSRVALPSSMLYVSRVRHSGSSTDPTTWASTREQPVEKFTPELIGLLDKASTVTGYPTHWTRKNNDLLIYPTPQTGYTCYLRVYGASREDALTAAGQAFRTDADWDDPIVLLASSRVSLLMDRPERAAELRAEAERILGTSMSAPAAERRTGPSYIVIAGTPR
jgi:hypothetical protein